MASLVYSMDAESRLLRELERSMEAVPEDGYKYDPRPATEAMANWIRAQDPSRRRAIVHALRRWLPERDSWHADAALDLAVELRSVDLIDAAVEEARRPQSLEAIVEERYLYVLPLIGALSRLPTPLGVAWLRELKAGASTAMDSRVREVTARASIALCFMAEASTLNTCVTEALSLIRSWGDPQVARSALALIGVLAHERGAIDQLAPLLTEDEARVAFSVWRS